MPDPLDEVDRLAAEQEAAKRARRGDAPDHGLTHPLPPGLVLRGTSILYDDEGNVREYWNKSKPEGMDPEAAVQLPDPKVITKVATLYDQEGDRKSVV